MSAKRKWTYELLLDEAKKYKTRKEFMQKNIGAYSSAHKQKLIDEVCFHMPKPTRWDFESLWGEAKKYTTRSRFAIGNQGAYCTAKKMKILDLICSHMNYAKGGTDNDCIYVWEAEGCLYNNKKIYKIGVTSYRLNKQRIKDVAYRTGFKAKILCFVKTKTKATDLEKILLQIGENPNFSNIEGSSEFRALNNNELNIILWLIKYGTELANG